MRGDCLQVATLIDIEGIAEVERERRLVILHIECEGTLPGMHAVGVQGDGFARSAVSETIIGANVFKDFFAGIRDIVGGRAGSYEKVLRDARDSSMREMMQQAQAMGANAVVGIDIDYETIGANGSMLMVAVSGTAVVI